MPNKAFTICQISRMRRFEDELNSTVDAILGELGQRTMHQRDSTTSDKAAPRSSRRDVPSRRASSSRTLPPPAHGRESWIDLNFYPAPD